MLKLINAIIIVCLLVCSARINAQEEKSSTNVLILKGDDFRETKQVLLACENPSDCWSVQGKDKKTIRINLIGRIEEKSVHLSIEVPVKKGSFRIKLDQDADPKPGEKFELEIFGSNSAVDKVTYTPEITADEVTIRIDEMNESTGQLRGSFSGKFMNGDTGVKRAGVSCSFSLRNQ